MRLPELDAAVGTLRPGERVGPYQLLYRLGIGGMAQVWLAHRASGGFERDVALKVPMLWRMRQDLANRFARECDILARLQHPNIVRLYESGMTLEGQQYLAMEYVAGQPLLAWCDDRRLGLRARLTLFLQVLEAVQYAHERHVIHRDIKPSNILVTALGEVRLLDFGAAKLMEPRELYAELTQVYGRALTPEYASPELIRGNAVSIASDVYGLGIVLYELLAGRRPYRVKAGAAINALERQVLAARVKRPSAQLEHRAGAARDTTQDQLARRLKGDLDSIVLKALARDPAHRYGSVTALGDDLRRFLAGEPVQARPDRFIDRLTRLVARMAQAARGTRVARSSA